MELELFFIHCEGHGYWSDLGEFSPELKGATAYTDKNRALTDAKDLEHSVFTGGKISMISISATLNSHKPV